MLSKADIKQIHSLALKKYRLKYGLFLAQGGKLVEQLALSFRCSLLAATAGWLESHPHMEAERKECTDLDTLRQAGLQQAPQDVLALFRIPSDTFSIHIAEESLCLALDGVQDPGNMGTIVRIADWFGIEHIFCSYETADIYGPKTVQATMGAMARVKVHYTDLARSIRELAPGTPVYGTFLDGEVLGKAELQQNGLIIMGNEGNGISEEVAAMVTRRLTIPSYPPQRVTSESLNVATAAAIVCAEFRRSPL